MGFGTNRVVGKTLNKTGLTSTQMKGMNTLQNICGVKKTDKNENEIIEKISSIKKDDGHTKSKLFENIEPNSNTSTTTTENPTTEKKKLGFSLKNLII
jgi:hypothetical protein